MAFYGTLGDIDLVSTDYPSIQPTLDLNFAKTKALDPRITFYRNSLATYTDSQGIIRTVPENVPRFDHDPTTGESLGLLIEESRTNLITYSQDFSNVNWSKYNLTTSLSNVLSPDGVSYSYKLTEDSTNSFKFVDFGITMGTGFHTVSAWMKAAERTQGSIFITQGGNLGAVFDLSNGTVVSVSDVNNSASIVAYPNGWYRCSVTNNGTLNINDSIRIGINNGAIGSYQGNGTSGIYVWGAQVEVGAFPTSYIPTSGTTVTRAQDIVEMTGTNFSSWYNQTEGTVSAIYRGGKTSELPVGYGRIAQTQQWSLEVSAPTTNRAFGVLSTGVYNAIFNLTDSWTTVSKYAVAWSNSTFNAHASEGVLGTVTGNTTFSNTPSSITFGASVNGLYGLNGHLSRFTFYPKRLTNTQLQNLTS